MALDTNIALGVKPIEQPNMLGQMAQMMQIRQAQQEYQSQNALSDSYSQAYAGGKFDPQAVIRGLVESGQGHLVPKVEAQMLKAEQDRANTKKTQVDTLGKEYENARVGLTNITDEAGYYDWVKSSFSNPAIASHLIQLGITPEKALANAQAAVAKEGLSTAIAKSAMGIGKFIEQDRQLKNATQNAQISAGPGNRQATVAEQKWAQEQAQLKAIQNIVSPERTSSATAIPINISGGGAPTTQMPPVSGVQTPTAGVAPVTPPAGAVTPPTSTVGKPNVLATQVAPPPTTSVPTTVNNLGQGSQKEQLVDQISQLARIPTTAASRALEMKVKEYNVLYPTEKIEQDRQGNLITIVNGVSKPVVNANGLPVQGKPLPETAFESTVGKKTGEETVAFVNRAQAAPKNIAKIDEALGILKSGGAVTGFGAEVRLNLERAKSLFANDLKAGKRVVDTQILDSLLGSDVFPSLQAMGLGSKNIDTPAEREFIRQVITGTIQLDNDALIRLTQIRRNVETNAIKEYNQKLESGKFNKYSKAADQKLEKIEVPNPIIRSGRLKDGRLVNEYADGTIDYAN